MAESGLFGGSRDAAFFSDGDRPYFDLVRLVVYSGLYVDALSVSYQDKTIGPVLPPTDPGLFTIFHGGAYQSLDHRLPDPVYFELAREHGEVLTGFEITYGDWIDTLTIITSSGRRQNFGGNDGHFGPKLATISVDDPSQQRIYSLKGTAGWYINKLGIYYGPR